MPAARLSCIWACLVTLVVTGCTLHGEGPVELSTRAAHAYGQYQQIVHNKAFAVTTDGKAYGVAYCPDFKCTGNVQSQAIKFCEQSEDRKRQTTAACKILAVDEQVLWDGEVILPDVGPETYYALNAAEGVEIRGPDQATGAVVYVPGNHPDRDLPQDDSVVPFYVRTFAQNGWDAFKLIPANDDLAGHDRAAAGVQARLQQLRDKGYDRVVVAAQSFGAWIAIHGGGNEAFGADAVIAAVPASFGSRDRDDGRPNPFFNRNKSDLIPMLRRFNGRLMLILFEGDPFDPGGRAYLTRDILTKRGVEHAVIDRPPGFSGHGSAWLAAFDFVFGACLLDFVQRQSLGAEFECSTPVRDPQDHRWMTKEAHLQGSPARLAGPSDLEKVIGNTLVGHLPNGDVAEYFLLDREHTVVRIRSGYLQMAATQWDTRVRENGICFPSQCYRVYLWDENVVIVVDDAGNIALRGEIIPGDVRGLGSDRTS